MYPLSVFIDFVRLYEFWSERFVFGFFLFFIDANGGIHAGGAHSPACRVCFVRGSFRFPIFIFYLLRQAYFPLVGAIFIDDIEIILAVHMAMVNIMNHTFVEYEFVSPRSYRNLRLVHFLL